MASSEAEQSSNPPKLKKCVLRVSIHCHGCQRKVRKILQSVKGVEDIEIEIKLQRVVVTGDVSPEILIRKLLKSGKQAELWPEKEKEKEKVKEKEKPPEIIRVQKTEKPVTVEESVVSEKQIKPPVTKPEVVVEDPSKITDKDVSSGGVPASNGGGKVNESVGRNDVEKVTVEVKAEEKKPETGSAGNQASESVIEKKDEQTEKTGGTGGGNGGGEGGGEIKKKKKKKSQNNNSNGETSKSAPPPVNHGGGPPATRLPSNQIPPRHQGYEYLPPYFYTPPPAPVYTVSYNTSHPPVNSYTASYYAPPQPPQSYAYSHYESEMEHQRRPPPPPPQYVPSDYDSYRQHTSDSFEMFSDENPNGCLVM